MKKIIFTPASGGLLAVLSPAPWARFCSAITVDGKLIEFDPPVMFDGLVRAYKTADLDPIWTETEDEFIARIMAKDVPDGATNVEIVDEAAIPSDRTFRNAWAATGKTVAVDMPKARDITRDRLREERKPLLEAKDVEAIRAMEIADKTKLAEIIADKQRLRDITALPEIEAATTPADLIRISL